jgi:branched-chain amino acid transport system substrate-binding protein
MKKIYPFLLISLLLLLLPGCSEEEQKITPSGNTITIGVIGPMSGPYRALGEKSMQGIHTALHMHPYLNNGDSLKLIVEDDQNEPELTVKALKKLAETDDVEAVLLLSTSASALAVNAIADSYQIPVLVLMATHPDIGINSQFVIQICFDNTFQGNVAALFVRDELLIERVAALKNPESFYSSSLVDAFVEQFSSIEGQVTEVVAVEAEKTAYDDLLPRLRDQKVQLLYLPVATEQVIAICKALHNMDWNPQVMGGDNFLNMVIAQQEQDFHYLDGFLATDLYSSTEEITPYGQRAAKIFRSLFQRNYSTLPASGFEGMAILLHAMNRCSAVKSKCINTRLHETVEFEGIMGNISIRKNGKAERPLIINRIRGREMEFVVKVY